MRYPGIPTNVFKKPFFATVSIIEIVWSAAAAETTWTPSVGGCFDHRSVWFFTTGNQSERFAYSVVSQGLIRTRDLCTRRRDPLTKNFGVLRHVVDHVRGSR